MLGKDIKCVPGGNRVLCALYVNTVINEASAGNRRLYIALVSISGDSIKVTISELAKRCVRINPVSIKYRCGISDYAHIP